MFEQETVKSDVSKQQLQSELDSAGEAARARGRLPLSTVGYREQQCHLFLGLINLISLF